MTAAMDVTVVRVTEKHIADGIACNSARCPIAIALHEALAAKGVQQVQGLFVDETKVSFSHYIAPERHQYRADLPAEATEFIQNFDGGASVEPIEFTLTWREL